MSWAKFDDKLFPHVFVDLGPNLDDEGFLNFTEDWKNLYKRRENFYLIFNTDEVGFVNPKYAWKMANFINELKQQQEELGKEYLIQSFIFYKSWYVKFLLNIIFFIQPPISRVDILPSDKNILNFFRQKINLLS